MIHVTVNEKQIELPAGTTAKGLAEKLHLNAPQEALTVSIDGGPAQDMDTSLPDGAHVSFVPFDCPEGKEVFWHTSAHVLAQAVLRLYPQAKPTIGPPIEQGFYYDFGALPISDSDLEKIEKEMQVIVAENYTSKREAFSSKAHALEAFGDNKYKCELIESFPAGSPLTGYRQGEFFDLCRGPHLPNIGKIKALKLLKLSGAYWRGDAKNDVLTRIYGISFPDRKQLKEYLERIEEAKKRDHKVVGPKLDLFSLKEEAPGMPFIHPKGMYIWNQLLTYMRERFDSNDYVEIKTPALMTKDLWERSGHWANYRQNMFTSHIEERDFAIKPMNCPGGMLFYKTHVHSYRELPLRVAEIGHVHRFEPSGSLSGLFRVRGFHQDDAHLFMETHQIQDEILRILKLSEEVYSVFGLHYHLELSTRPKENTIGSDQDWENATKGLQGALEVYGREYRINEGDGAFYGPKIDIHIRDAIHRTWQCGTIQLDMALPERFDLEYTAQDGSKKRPVMLHRVIYGSVERFFGILIEHFSGKFPLWLSPVQVRFVIVADRHLPFATQLKDRLRQENFQVEIDASHESVSKKIRTAQLMQANYIVTIGDKEVENQTINLRTRDNVVHGEMQLDAFLVAIRQERSTRALTSPFQPSAKS